MAIFSKTKVESKTAKPTKLGKAIKSIKQDLKEQHELILAITNRGYADYVIDASRDAGASGATILYGRGTTKKDEEFNGVTIQTEKEIVMILVKKSLRKKVMQEIGERTHIQEKGNGICFCLPVNEIKGLTQFEKESLDK